MTVSRLFMIAITTMAVVCASPALYSQATDDCASAPAVGEGSSSYDLTGSTLDGSAVCDSNIANDVWVSYTASCSGTATFGTCAQSGSNDDSVLAVYDGGACPSAGDPCLASSDDACGASAFMSEVSMPVTGGSTYLIQVAGWNGGEGDGTLDISLVVGSNDDCAGATCVGEGSHAYDLTGSTLDGPADCDSNMQNDVWMSYTASCTGMATIGTCAQSGGNDDSVIIVYDGGACPTAGDPCLASSDDACGSGGFMSEVSIPVTGGQSYLIQIGGWNGSEGDGTLDISLVAGSNDDCCAATPVAEGSHAYDLTGSTLDGPSDCDSNMQNDVWMLYTASCDGDATIGTCSQSGANDDSVIIVYDGGSCPSAGAACLASSDDACGSGGFMSEVTIPVTAGSSYLVQIGGWNGSEGDGTLDIALASPAEADCANGIDDDCDGQVDCDDSDCAGSTDCSNDDCAGAYPAGEGSHAYDLTGSTLDGPSDCDSNIANDVWFAYTPSANGTATIGTCAQSGSNDDSVLAVYDGATCPTAGATCLASSDDACGSGGFMSTVDVAVTGGNTYLIQVAGWNGGEGDGTLDISLVACTNDDCCGADQVGEGSHAYDLTGSTLDGPADCDSNMENDVWMLYTASCDGLATIGTCAQSGANDDSVIIVYDGDSCPVAGDACLASSDDACGSGGFMSEVTIPVSAGSSYYIQIGGWNGSEGDGTLDIACAPNDVCENAVAFTEGANSFDTTGYATSGLAPTGCSNAYGNNAQDLFATYTPPADGIVDFNTCDAGSFDTDIALYEGDCSALTLVACDGDSGAAGCQQYSSALNGLILTGGTTYIVNIGGWGAADQGAGTCNITFTALAAEDCATPGDEDGDGDADCADSDCAAEPQCQEAGNCADFIDNDLDGDVDCADADCAADAACAGCPTGLSQNVSDVVDTSSVLCANAGQVAGDNTYARSFDTSSLDCPTGIRVTGVNFGIGLVTNPDGLGIPVTISVWHDGDGGAADGGMTLISSEDVLIFEADATSTQSLTLATPAALPSGATLVVGTTLHDTVGSGNLIRVGHNSAGQSGPIYFDATACGLSWGTLDAIGFGDNHVVITIITDDQGAGAAGDECAVAISVTEGANAFDATDMTTGAEPPESCGPGTGGFNNDMWFTYTASYAGNLTVDTCSVGSYDTDCAVYTDCPGSGGTLIACNGDAPDAASGAGGACQTWYSSVDVGIVAAGQTVTIRVAAYSPGAGTGTLNITNIPPPPTLNEIRIDNPGGDTDEYFELAGLPQSLDGLSYIVIGDGTGGSGTIENVTDLTGQSMGGSGYWWAGEASATLGTPDMVTTLSFENSDNVTHMLVSGFTGASGDDLDTDDDGTLDSTPWDAVIDSVAMLENEIDPATGNPSGGEMVYSSTTIGPDGTFVPGHIEICNGVWEIADFDHAAGSDTPGAANSCLAPPANDECVDAFTAVLGSNSVYNVSATDSADAWDTACVDSTGGAMAVDVWHVWTAGADGTLTVSTCDTAGFDTDSSISTGACGALTQIACSGDAGDGSGNSGACQPWYSEYTVAVTSGTTYYLRNGGWSSGDQGTTNLELSFVPVGDEPCDAIAVTDGTTIVDNTSASDSTVPIGADADSNCTGTFLGQFDSDMWFSYTATCEGTVTIDTCDAAGIDTDLAVYEGDCATLDQPIACNGDDTTLPGCQGFTSLVEFTATLGATYLIRVGGWSDNSGGVTEMHISCAPDAVDPTASFVLSGYSEYSINFRPVTLTDSSDNGGDVNAMITVDWGDGSPTETAAPGSSLPHVYAIALVPGATGFLATPSVTITNVVGSNTISGDQLTVLLIGDANNDLASDAADVVTVLTYLYGGGTYNCYQVADLNGDETVNLGDIVYALYYFFVPGSDIPVLPSNPNCDL